MSGEIGMNLTLRNIRLSAVVTFLDGATDPGSLLLYAGTRPATGGSPESEESLLAIVPLDRPCGSVDAGELTFAFADPIPAQRGGTPIWGRFVDGNGTFALDGGVGEGELIQVDTVTIYAGGIVSGVSGVLTEGNP